MNNKNNKNRLVMIIPYIVICIFIVSMFFKNPFSTTGGTKILSYNEFHTSLNENKLSDVKFEIASNTIEVTGKYADSEKNNSYFKATLPNSEAEMTALTTAITKKGIAASATDANKSNALLSVISNIVPLVIFLVLGIYLMRMMASGGGNQKAFDFTKNKARLEKDIKVRFSDIAGCEEEKEEMVEIIDYLKSPKKFADMGARIPKGVLLFGNPGTGKTLLAKAVAGEAGVPFYSISGSDFVEMFVGVGASRVREMFKQAKATAPSMIFIDEIDAVGRQRGAGLGGGHDEREQTLNQLLVEMDGIGDNTGIVIIAATNRPDVLDPALLRPGRFDRQITVGLPDVKAREQILKVHARNKKLAEDVNLAALAKRTPGFSGAELENVLNEAAILAVRENRKVITLANVDEAIDRTMMGPAKKSKKYDEETKKLVAYHEAGHAIVGLNLKEGTIVQKVTIIPRGQAGGYNLMTPKKEKILNSKNDLLDSITSYMGGRCAEEFFFNDITTGASNDIEQATNIAKSMVTVYGMSELGPIKYNHDNGNVFLGRDYTSSASVSGEVAAQIDKAVRDIVDSCHDRALEIIKNNKDKLIEIAEALLVLETITGDEIQGIFDGTMWLDKERVVKKEEIKPEDLEETEVDE